MDQEVAWRASSQCKERNSGSPPDTWLQMVANRRISEEDGWAYRKFVYNIYYGRRSDANRLLASKAPVVRLNRETQLW